MLFAANQSFINFHLTAKPVAVRANHRCAEAVQHRPGRLVRTEAQQALERLCRDTVLRRCHVPGNGEPNRERRTGAVEDRPHGHRYATPTAFTPEPPVAHPPVPGGPAKRAHKTGWPAQPLKVVETGVIVGKPCAELSIIARVIPAGLENRGRQLLRHNCILCLPHSDGHPPSDFGGQIGARGSGASPRRTCVVAAGLAALRPVAPRRRSHGVSGLGAKRWYRIWNYRRWGEGPFAVRPLSGSEV